MNVVERKCRVEINTNTIFIDVVFKGSGIIHVTPFTFKPGKILTVLSWDNEDKIWLDTWIFWKGFVGRSDVVLPSAIEIHCKDSRGFKWISPLKEFLNPRLFTTKEWIDL